MTDVYGTAGIPPRRRRAQLNWIFTFLPAFPLVLLVLRLWYLSRQDMPTMLLLVQHVSPLGMVSALFITLIWAVPAVILVLRLLGGILLVSAPTEAGGSLLAVTALRMPDWVVVVAVGLASFTWQLRMLPVLCTVAAAILGLTAVQRYPRGGWLMAWIQYGVPAAVGLLVLIFVWPGVLAGVQVGEFDTALLLGVPPLLGPLFTGPIPERLARVATHWPALGAALIAPFVVGVVFLRAPVLPSSAVEVLCDHGTPAGCPDRAAARVSTAPDILVIRGQLIDVDDTATTVLDDQGRVQIIRNDHVRSKTLCPDKAQPLDSRVVVRGWPVGASALEWAAPTLRITDVDPRCLGRSDKLATP